MCFGESTSTGDDLGEPSGMLNIPPEDPFGHGFGLDLDHTQNTVELAQRAVDALPGAIVGGALCPTKLG